MFSRFVTGILCCGFLPLHGQFQNVTDLVGEHYTVPGTYFGSGLSFYDFDGDGWDDLTIGLGSDAPKFFKNENGTFVPASFDIPTGGNGHIVMMLWADYDNDGDEDLLITKNPGPVELWRNDGADGFVNVATPAGLNDGSYIYSGAAFADYNHDGCLDLYISKFYYHQWIQGPQYHNILYKNNCDGTFTAVTGSAGVDVVPSFTFQPVFFDYNKDGWEDLYLINEFNETPNNLFHNNGDGTFTEVSESTGAGIYIDAMTGTVGDFNNDLLLDIFVTNRTATGGNHLMVDQGNATYVNEAPQLGFGTNYQSWGAVWLDYNNNGWQDIFVSIPLVGSSGEDGNNFYVNHAGEAFTNERDSLGFSEDFSRTYVCARGDLNNDGYYDLAHNSRTETPFQLYQNTGGDHHYLSVTLEGTLSNSNGIGSWIYCYAGDHQALHYTMCGENLIGQNTDKYIFGLGDNIAVDSLVVEWNRGTREVYTNLEVDQHLHLVEGASFTQPFEISYDEDLLLCAEDTTILDAGDYEQYLWNTGDTTQTISVSEPGIYSVQVWNEFGLSASSFPVEVTVAPPAEITIDKTNVSCAGANDGVVEVSFSNGPVAEILWNSGDTTTTLEDLGPEVYSFAATDDFGCPVEGSVSVEEPSPLLGQAVITDVTCYGEPTGIVDLNIIGGTLPFSVDWLGENPDALYAGNYVVSISDMNGCAIDVAYEIGQPDSLWANININHASNGMANGSADIEVYGGTSPYTVIWSNGVIDTVSIAGLAPGNHNVLVTDAHGCTWQQDFVIETNTGYHALSVSTPVIFPNPSNGWLSIANCGSATIDYRVFDAAGRIVHPLSTAPCPGQLNFGHLADGAYILELSGAGQVFRQRLLVGR